MVEDIACRRVCLSVTDAADFFRTGFSRPVLHCVLGKLG